MSVQGATNRPSAAREPQVLSRQVLALKRTNELKGIYGLVSMPSLYLAAVAANPRKHGELHEAKAQVY